MVGRLITLPVLLYISSQDQGAEKDFKKIIQLDKTQFQANIKAFQTAWGGEYRSLCRD